MELFPFFFFFFLFKGLSVKSTPLESALFLISSIYTASRRGPVLPILGLAIKRETDLGSRLGALVLFSGHTEFPNPGF